MNDANAANRLDDRFLKVLPNLIEWAKHLITIASAIMVLSAALLKDLVTGAGSGLRVAVVFLLVGAYLLLLAAIWEALRFISVASSMVLTMSSTVVTNDELARLHHPFSRGQELFRAGMASFAALALVVLFAWAFQ